MCWSIEVSLIACAYGYLVSWYLYKRKYSLRDPWYAAFLFTFTTTQLCDALLWSQQVGGQQGHLDNSPIQCTPLNLIVSKYIVPPVVFFQPIILSLYPSKAGIGWCRNIYRGLVLLGCLVLMVLYGCSTLWHAPSTAHDNLPTILWGGVELPTWTVQAGILLWALGAVGFIRPVWYGIQILLTGGIVLSLLYLFDGTIILLSKMCTYCLLLSIVWLGEPIWDPNPPSKNINNGEPLLSNAQSVIVAI
jgi:hypothetical protein